MRMHANMHFRVFGIVSCRVCIHAATTPLAGFACAATSAAPTLRRPTPPHPCKTRCRCCTARFPKSIQAARAQLPAGPDRAPRMDQRSPMRLACCPPHPLAAPFVTLPCTPRAQHQPLCCMRMVRAEGAHACSKRGLCGAYVAYPVVCACECLGLSVWVIVWMCLSKCVRVCSRTCVQMHACACLHF